MTTEPNQRATAEVEARAIIKRISDAAIELAVTRHSLETDEFDAENYPDAKDGVDAFGAWVEEVKIDTLNCLTGDDTGCFDEEDLDETNCELIWLRAELSRREAAWQGVVDAARNALTVLLQTKRPDDYVDRTVEELTAALAATEGVKEDGK